MSSLISLMILLAGLSVGQADVNSSEPASTPQQRLAFAKEAAAKYRFQVESTKTDAVTLHPTPLLRWDNHVVREDDGLLFLWTEGPNGRPVAMAQFFLQGGDWHHEFQSLNPHPFRTEHADLPSWNWSPAKPGVNFTTVSDGMRPSNSVTQRLRQMRTFAEQFTAAVDTTRRGKFESPHELRLLTTPVYRYAAESSGTLDGGMFAYVQGTNPEVIILIEAVRSPGGDWEWHYGFAPMSSFELRVRKGEETVFQQPVAIVPTADLSSTYHFRWKAQADGSAAIEVDDSAKK